jgi:hypothetical protein
MLITLLGLIVVLGLLGLAGLILARAVFGSHIGTVLLIVCASGLLMAFRLLPGIAIMGACCMVVWGISRMLPKGGY